MFLLALSVAPGFAISIFIYYRDKFKKEPLTILLFSFLLGMLAIMPAILLEEIDSNFSYAINNYYLSNFISAFLVVAFSEEFCKFIMLKWYSYRHKSFDEPFDGIVYSVIISMGFATLENWMYIMDGGLEVGVWRMFTAVPAHAVNAVMIGHYVGLQKLYPNKKYLQWIGLLLSVIFHGSYDYFLFISNNSLIIMGALIALVSGIIASFYAIRIHKKINQDLNRNEFLL